MLSRSAIACGSTVLTSTVSTLQTSLSATQSHSMQQILEEAQTSENSVKKLSEKGSK
jgi:hypothetical protein